MPGGIATARGGQCGAGARPAADDGNRYRARRDDYLIVGKGDDAEGVRRFVAG
jgi:hypothetical protein